MTSHLVVEQVVTGADTYVVQVTVPRTIGGIPQPGGVVVLLSPQQAEAASNELWNASSPPPECRFCAALASTTVEGNEPACNDHARALDQVEQVHS